jgi:rhodanese-related sulfurtransferase
MKKLSLLLIGLLMLPILLLTSCDRGDDPAPPTDTTNKYTILKDYMVGSSYDLQHVMGGTGLPSPSFVVDPPADQTAVDAFLAPYFVMDIRAAADFATGRIPGATNVLFSNILTATASVTKPILVVCYTGNQATYATALLRMYGKRDAVALKWGMSGWNPLFATQTNGYTSKIGNIAVGNANWNPANTAAPTNATYGTPNIILPATVGDAILKARVEAVVAAGFKSASVSAVLTTPTDYFINNYFSSADFAAYGHVKGAVRVQPFNLAGTLTGNLTNLNLDPTKKIATYCYTGQTSGIVTAWLRVLGYDAYSITFGMNGFWNDNPGWGTNGNKWTASKPKTLNYVQ